jgi:hypothetical protein
MSSFNHRNQEYSGNGSYWTSNAKAQNLKATRWKPSTIMKKSVQGFKLHIISRDVNQTELCVSQTSTQGNKKMRENDVTQNPLQSQYI